MSGFFDWFTSEQDKLKAPQKQPHSSCLKKELKLMEEHNKLISECRERFKTLADKFKEREATPRITAIDPNYKLNVRINNQCLTFLDEPGEPSIHLPSVKCIHVDKIGCPVEAADEYTMGYFSTNVCYTEEKLLAKIEEARAKLELLRNAKPKDIFTAVNPENWGKYSITILNISVNVMLHVEPGHLPQTLHLIKNYVKQVGGVEDVRVVKEWERKHPNNWRPVR